MSRVEHRAANTPPQTSLSVVGPAMKQSNNWYESKSAGNHQGVIADEVTGKTIAITHELTDAAHIVRCVNGYEDLLSLLKQFVKKVEMWPEGANPEYLPIMKQARKLIEQADSF